MKVLVTGITGQLGHDVAGCLEARGVECIGAGRDDFDITDSRKTERFISGCRPDAVVHCAAYTNVNKAEEEQELCRMVNAEGAANIARACKALDAKLVYISTDYVFAGTGSQFYLPGDSAGPVSTYGRTKYEGELAVAAELSKYFIVRISWVFGKNGNNFVKTMLRLGRERQEVKVVCDQFGSPTYTKDLAPLICDMLETDKYGTYHATNEGVCSWAEFAAEIFRQAGLPAKAVPIPAAEYPSPAARPENSRLSKQCLEDAGFYRLPDWKDALSRYLAELEGGN